MKLKNKWKPGLFFGLIMTITFLTWKLITADNLTNATIISIVIISLVGGVVAGLLFGLMTTGLARSRFVKETTKIALMEGEKIEFQSGATHCSGITGAGGKLYLTNKRLYFKSHALNLQTHDLTIFLHDIEQVDRYKSIGVINNGLVVSIKNGTTEKFIVEEASAWKKLLSPKVTTHTV